MYSGFKNKEKHAKQFPKQNGPATILSIIKTTMSHQMLITESQNNTISLQRID